MALQQRTCCARQRWLRCVCVAVWLGRVLMSALLVAVLLLGWSAVRRGGNLFGGATSTATMLPTAVAHVDWEYRDASGTIQGPFSALQMQQWDADGLLRPELRVRCVGSGAAFVPMRDIFASGAAPYEGTGTLSAGCSVVAGETPPAALQLGASVLGGSPSGPLSSPLSAPPPTTQPALPISIANRTLESIRRGTLFVLQLQRARTRELRFTTGTWRYGTRRRARAESAARALGFSPVCATAAFDLGHALPVLCADLPFAHDACTQRCDLLRYARPAGPTSLSALATPAMDCITGVNSLAYAARFRDELSVAQRSALRSTFSHARVVSGRFSYGVHAIGHRAAGAFLYITLLVDPTLRAVAEWLSWRRRTLAGVKNLGREGNSVVDAGAAGSIAQFVARISGEHFGAPPLAVPLPRDACPNHAVRTLCGDGNSDGTPAAAAAAAARDDDLSEVEGGGCAPVGAAELACAQRNLASTFLVLTR